MTQGFDQQGFQQQGFGQPQQGFAPQPQTQQGGFAPQPQQGGFAPQPQQGGFAPQPGGFAPQGGFPQAGGFASGQQAPGNTPKEFKPDGPLTGYASAPISDYIKLKDYQGSPVLLRMFGIEVKMINGRQTESLECDIIVLNPATRDYAQHNSQGIINSRIVGMGRRLMQSGIGVASGIVTLGEAQGGNQPPVQLSNIEDEAVAQFAYEVGVHVGWIVQEEAAPVPSQAPAPAAAQTPDQQMQQAPAQQQMQQAPAQGGTNPLG